MVAVLTTVDASMSPADVVRAAGGVARVGFVIDRAEAARVPALATVAAALAPTEEADFDDTASCVAAVRRLGAAAVLTFSDACCETVDRIRGDRPAPVRWAKDEQRRRLIAADLSTARQLPIRTPDEVRRAVAELGLPLVVKPVVGVGSRDVHLVRDRTEVEQVAALDRADLVAEQYVAGVPPVAHLADYGSVELFVGPGRCEAIVTNRLPLADPCRETGIVGPSPVDDAMRDHLIGVARAAHRALDLSVGAFHIELKMTSSAQVIEVNGRLGGFVRRLVQLGTGFDVGRTALGCHVGVDPVLDLQWQRHLVGLLFQPPRSARRIVTAPRRAAIAALDGVVSVDHLSPVDTTVDWRTGSGGAAAILWIAADDAVELRDRTVAATRALDGLFEFHDGAGRRVRDEAWLDRIAVAGPTDGH
jgi:biotin carboxylase